MAFQPLSETFLSGFLCVSDLCGRKVYSASVARFQVVQQVSAKIIVRNVLNNTTLVVFLQGDLLNLHDMNTQPSACDDTPGRFEALFQKYVFDRLPIVLFITEWPKTGQPFTRRKIWMNETGLRVTGYTHEEIAQLGAGCFMQILHPDDRGILAIPQREKHTAANFSPLVSVQRVRFKGQTDYHWSYCMAMITDTYFDGSPRQLLVVGMNFSEVICSIGQITELVNEINRKYNCSKLSCLTPREKEILRLITKGKTDKEIAELLFIDIVTAKKHRRNILHKMGARNSAELAALGTMCGLN